MSEGLDFADINGRAVIITGLPYPPRMEPKVWKLKEESISTIPRHLAIFSSLVGGESLGVLALFPGTTQLSITLVGKEPGNEAVI